MYPRSFLQYDCKEQALAGAAWSDTRCLKMVRMTSVATAHVCDWVPLESRQCWLKFELVDRHYSNRKPLFLPQNPGKSHVSVRIQTKRAWLKTSWFTPWTAARHEKHFGWDLVTQMLQPLSVLCVLFVFVSCLVDVVFSWNMQSSTWNAFFVVFDFHLTDRSPYVMECTAWARR